MALRFSTGCRNAILDSGLDAIFNNGVVEFRSGSQPAAADDAPTGTVLGAVDPLPADVFAAASGGSKAKSGTWEEAAADAAGVIGWFRLRQASDAGTQNQTDERIDGSVSGPGGGGDMIVSNTNVAVGQPITVTTFTLSIPAG